MKAKVQAGKEKAAEEEAKNFAQRNQYAQDKIDTLSQKSHVQLFRMETLFPFDLFPDTVIIRHVPK